MKILSKKKIFAIAVIAALAAILSLGSLAWFTDSEKVENDFLIADSDDEPDDVFSIDLYEMEDTDGDGVGDTKTDTGITYDYNDQEVIPGATLSKEAFVDNTGRYDQYVRVKVTLSKASIWLSVLNIQSVDEYVDLNKFFVTPDGFDETWHRNDADTEYDLTNDTLTYVYYFNGILSPDDDPVRFLKAVKIPGELTKEQAVEMDGSFDIDLVAEALQSENILETYGTVEYQNAIDSFAAVNS
ncbi:MAG: hypothetical protein II748_02175 [Clostridia bacterium]|nr:hypothetical protein [Clostridia bacterium]